MCDLFWKIYEMGIPVVVGPSHLARALGCPTPCDCDVVIHIRDAVHVGEKKCVWLSTDSTFIHRHIWVGGYPHVSIEDMKKIVSPEISETVDCIVNRLRNEPRGL
ncbi:MAG: hypothetical protein ACPL3C_07445 [Pyrobaculum sp.]|uniref:hypothetical protein n=1 Tax=Pyrobaculum sp. TaxID=2004705 RepID=UPI003CA3EB99